MPHGVKTITIAKSLAGTPSAHLLIEHFGSDAVTFVDDCPEEANIALGKRRLHLGEARGEALGLCASLHEEYVCCGAHVLKAITNCPFDCSYCVLQDYLGNTTTNVVADTHALTQEVREKTAREPNRLFRIGTWVLGDSLAWEEETRTASRLVETFSSIPNALLELKTKSDKVEPLLGLNHGGRTVISCSLNAESIITSEEHGTAPLQKRVSALKKAAIAGYPIALHFDPLLLFDGWENAYEEMVHLVFDELPIERIAWISLGSLRFMPQTKHTMERRFPRSRLTCAEMVLGPDGKLRYVKPLRLALYRHVYGLMKEWVAGTAPHSEPFIYFCMERNDVWLRILGREYASIAHHDFAFASSLYKRFPGLLSREPEWQFYADAY